MVKTRLTVGRTRDGYSILLRGRGTMRESMAIEAFAAPVLESEHGTLQLDLSDCENVDSTMLGCLISLTRRFGGKKQERFVVATPSTECMALFATHKLTSLLNVRYEKPSLIGEPIELSCADTELKALGRHVVECHRLLAGLGGPDAKAFAAIVGRIERELE